MQKSSLHGMMGGMGRWRTPALAAGLLKKGLTLGPGSAIILVCLFGTAMTQDEYPGKPARERGRGDALEAPFGENGGKTPASRNFITGGTGGFPPFEVGWHHGDSLRPFTAFWGCRGGGFLFYGRCA